MRGWKYFTAATLASIFRNGSWTGLYSTVLACLQTRRGISHQEQAGVSTMGLSLYQSDESFCYQQTCLRLSDSSVKTAKTGALAKATSTVPVIMAMVREGSLPLNFQLIVSEFGTRSSFASSTSLSTVCICTEESKTRQKCAERNYCGLTRVCSP